MDKTKMIFMLVVLPGIFLAGCDGSKKSANTEKGLWMEMDPVQCLGNPWEQAWLEEHNNEYGTYPKGKPRVVEQEEAEIIKAYFEARGINILDLDFKPYPNDAMVCDACSCSQGFTLFLKVNQEDRVKMEEYNFKRSNYETKDEK